MSRHLGGGQLHMSTEGLSPPFASPPAQASPPRRRLRSAGRRKWIGLVLVLALGGVPLVLLRPVRVAAQSLLILPEVLPDVPLRPLLWFSVPPERVEFDYESAT